MSMTRVPLSTLAVILDMSALSGRRTRRVTNCCLRSILRQTQKNGEVTEIDHLTVSSNASDKGSTVHLGGDSGHISTLRQAHAAGHKLLPALACIKHQDIRQAKDCCLRLLIFPWHTAGCGHLHPLSGVGQDSQLSQMHNCLLVSAPQKGLKRSNCLG